MFYLVQILVPVSICVILPVLIVWIIYRGINNRENKRAEVLIEAIRANHNVDVDNIAKAFQKEKKSPVEKQNTRLLLGSIGSLIGLVILGVSIWMWAAGVFNVDAAGIFFLIAFIFLSIGAGFMIVYYVARKQLKAETNKE